MIKDIVDRKAFIKKFTKSFSSFCKNAPIDISFSIGDKEITFFVGEKKKTHEFDFLKSVHENIFSIKETILPFYPVAKKEILRYVPLTTEEVKNVMQEFHLSFDEAFSRKKEIRYTKEFILEKVLTEKNSFVLWNKEDGLRVLAEMRSPIPFLCAKIKDLSSEEIYQLISNEKKREIEI